MKPLTTNMPYLSTHRTTYLQRNVDGLQTSASMMKRCMFYHIHTKNTHKNIVHDVWCILLYYCLLRIVKWKLSLYMVMFTSSKWEVQDPMNAALLTANGTTRGVMDKSVGRRPASP